MASSTTSWLRAPVDRRPVVAAAVVIGVVAGSLGRELPIALAGRVLPSRATRPCGMEEVLECLVRDFPGLLGQMLLLGLVVVVIEVVLGVMGVALTVVGIVRVRRAGHSLTLDDWVGPALLSGGVALVVPAALMLGSFVVVLVR